MSEILESHHPHTSNMALNVPLTDSPQPALKTLANALAYDRIEPSRKRSSFGQPEESCKRQKVFRVFRPIDDASIDPFDNVTTLLAEARIKVPSDLTENDLRVLKTWMRVNRKKMNCASGNFDIDGAACEKLKTECLTVVKWLKTGLERGTSSRAFRDVQSCVYKFRNEVSSVYNERQWEM